MTTLKATLARVCRVDGFYFYGYQGVGSFIGETFSEQTPALLEDGPVEPSISFDVLAWVLGCPLSGTGHVLNLGIFNGY